FTLNAHIRFNDPARNTIYTLSLHDALPIWAKGEAAVIGWLLQTKALIMIIFANVLLDREIIASDTFTALLLMAVASTMLTIPMVDRKSTRLNSIHVKNSYAVFCMKKKNITH